MTHPFANGFLGAIGNTLGNALGNLGKNTLNKVGSWFGADFSSPTDKLYGSISDYISKDMPTDDTLLNGSLSENLNKGTGSEILSTLAKELGKSTVSQPSNYTPSLSHVQFNTQPITKNQMIYKLRGQ